MIILTLFLMLISSSYAYLNCNYNPKPYIKEFNDRIYWYCETNQSNCISYATFNDEVIQVNPERSGLEGVGLIESFNVTNGIVNPYFTGKDLRDNNTVQFVVRCGQENFTANVTPLYKDLFVTIDTGIWIKQNIFYMMGILFLLFVFVFFIVWLIKMFIGGFKK